ncbi:unnamed protein product, partial [Symbiodinium necroappetens]
KIRYFAFMIHYNMPFVDDIRIIVDWTVAPTTLDLWMYWKVEDAHTAFYRSRHVMFVRSQSYYAEERDPLEKIYSGWAILCLVVLVILMPIIVFSPFSPFPNTVLIDEATLSLELTMSGAKEDAPDVSTAGELAAPAADAFEVEDEVADVDPGPVAMTAATRVPAVDAAGARGHNWNGEDGGEELYWGHKTRRVFSLQPARPSAGRADVDSFLRGFFETRKGFRNAGWLKGLELLKAATLASSQGPCAHIVIYFKFDPIKYLYVGTDCVKAGSG